MVNQCVDYVYRGLAEKPAGTATFPVLSQGGSGMQLVTIPPGNLLTPHWHPNSSETTYCLEGEGVVGLVIPRPTCFEPVGAVFQKYPYSQGDVVFLPQGYAHYFLNSGSQDLVVLLTFDNPDFDILPLADVLHELPQDVIEAVRRSVDAGDDQPVIPY